MYTVHCWLEEKDIIKFLIKAKSLGGIEQAVFILPQLSGNKIKKLMRWDFPEDEKGKEFYEWASKNNR